jgi:hypothetical protein
MKRRQSQRQAEAADEALLTNRLRELGLHGVAGIQVHCNRTVLVTVTARRMLRVHRGYAYAPDRVLEAIVNFVSPKSTKHGRTHAQRTITGFPVERYVSPRHARRRREPGDQRYIGRLKEMHHALNERYFEAGLASIPIRVSNRMRTRLGELSVSTTTGAPLEIAISRTHIVRDGWEEVRHTLLHEMVHQWQVESGLELSHGSTFRAKARAVGIEPRARRDVSAVRSTIME